MTPANEHSPRTRAARLGWNRAAFPLAAGAFLLVVYLLAFLAGPDRLRAVTREDGLVEWSGALAFLAASLGFAIAFALSRTGSRLLRWQTRRNVFPLLLAFLCFFAFGEEIAWGQRLLDLPVPQFFIERNIQQDLTIHNLDILVGGKERVKTTLVSRVLNINTLFQAFTLGAFVVLPAASRISRTVRRWLEPLGVLVVPVGLGVLFPVNYAISKVLEAGVPPGYGDGVTELKEALFAFVFVALAAHVIGQMIVIRHADRSGVARQRSAAEPRASVGPSMEAS